MRMPLSMPSGTLSRRVTTSEILPLPLQLSQETSMILPRPPHVEQVCVLTICPRKLSRTVRTTPAPPQVEQEWDSVPPTPSQTEQFFTVCTLTSRSTP